MKHTKNKLSRLCILCGALCAVPLGAQQAELQKGYFSGALDFWGNAPSSFAASRALPSERQLAEAPVATAPQTALLDTGMNENDRPLLFEMPEENPGIGLGTPVKETSLFLAALAVLYGIIARLKIRPSH
jgi:hypothetical protein